MTFTVIIFYNTLHGLIFTVPRIFQFSALVNPRIILEFSSYGTQYVSECRNFL